MPHRATIVTSVPSRLKRQRGQIEVGPAYLMECLTSWQAAGFHVISLNPEEEAKELERLGLPIEIRALDYAGLPFVGDVVRAAEASSTELCGIVNSDCGLIALPSLIDRLIEKTSDRLLLAERLDIDANTGKPFPPACGGYDGFFFKSHAIDWTTCLTQSHAFRIGDPMWDYWFPCRVIADGHNVGRIALPILTHLDHPRRWDQEKWHQNAKIVRSELNTLPISQNSPQSFKALVSSIVDESPNSVIKIPSIGDYVWSSSACVPVFLYDVGEEAHFLEIMLCRIRDAATQAYLHPAKKGQRLYDQKPKVEVSIRKPTTLLRWLEQTLRNKNRERLARRRRRRMEVSNPWKD